MEDVNQQEQERPTRLSEMLASFALVFFITLAMTLYYAWPVWLVWSWFVSPLLGLPEFNYWEVVGLYLFFLLLKGARQASAPVQGAKDWDEWIAFVILPPALTGVAYVVRILA